MTWSERRPWVELVARSVSVSVIARAWVLAMLVGGLGSIAVAFAQAGDADTVATTPGYDATVELALQEYGRGRWEEAAALFRQAHQQNPSARTLRGLGLAMYEARHYPDAIRYLSEALTDTRRPLTDKQRDEVQTSIQRAKLFVGYLDLRVQPDMAKVLINGQPIDADRAHDVVTEIGWQDIEVSAAHYKTSVRRLQINAGDKQQLTVQLEPEQDTIPLTPSQVSLPAPNVKSQATSSTDALSTWKWIAAGTAVAALGTGAALLVVQKVEAPSYEKQCVQSSPKSDCQARHDFLKGTLWDGAITAFAIGGALTALTVTLFAIDSHTNEQPRSSLSCHAGPMALTCTGSF